MSLPKNIGRNAGLLIGEVNLLVTAGLILLSVYISFVAILQQPFISPTSTDNSHKQNSTTTTTKILLNSSENDTANEEEEEENTAVVAASQQFSATFFSIFLLWALALAAGHLFHRLKLPQLLGMLLVGIVFANIPALNGLLVMRDSWTSVLRSCAFVLILLRCGIGLNPEVLRRSLCPQSLSTCAELLAIVLVAHFGFHVPLSISILFGFVLASTSPAVTVPTMLQLQQAHRGTAKGIPTIALASASIDNIFCISGFAIAYAILSRSGDDNLGSTLLHISSELLLSIVVGFFLGFLLRVFPSPKHRAAHHLHLARVLLLFSLSNALFFGSRAIHLHVGGPIAVMLTCFLAASAWKGDNPGGTHVEAEALRQLWNLLLLPLLFVLIGLLFDFSIFTWQMLAQALVLLLMGIVVRMLSAFGMARAKKVFSLKETMFFSVVFLPKATVQAALAPQLFAFSLAVINKNSNSSAAQFTLQTCILSILLTAPLGQLVIQQLGSRFLSMDSNKEENGLNNNGKKKKKKKKTSSAAAAHKASSSSKNRKNSCKKNGGGNAAVVFPNDIDIVVGLPDVMVEAGKRRGEHDVEADDEQMEEEEEDEKRMKDDIFVGEEEEEQEEEPEGGMEKKKIRKKNEDEVEEEEEEESDEEEREEEEDEDKDDDEKEEGKAEEDVKTEDEGRTEDEERTEEEQLEEDIFATETDNEKTTTNQQNVSACEHDSSPA